MFRRFLAMGLASLTLASCASTGGQDYELTGARDQTLEVNIKRGDFVRLGPFVSTSSKCAKVGQAKIRLVTAPRGGHVSIGSRPGEISYNEGARFAYCNGRPIAGASVEYRTRPGFAGDDYFSVHLVFGDGEQRTIRVHAHVD
jgi:hypothetical protein